MEFELFAIGLLLSLAFAGLTGLYAGGIIVPAYLVFYVDQPARVAGTLVAALLALLAGQIIGRYVLVVGKRQFVLMILLGALFMSLIGHLLPGAIPQTSEFKVLGWVIPGLIAHTFHKQGVLITVASIVTVTVGVYFAGRLLLLLA
jgi:poly-gamma-glutamate biosynthesis protein PgsC/CapC